jgi:hypothetical protein
MRCVASAHRAAPRVEPCASRTLRLTNIPFAVPVTDVAHGALAALASAGNLSLVQCVTRVAVGDFSQQGVTEWDNITPIGAADGGLVALPPPYDGADTQAPRRPRDVGKHNRGFAVLCFASRAAAAVAATALEALPPGAVQLRTSDALLLTDVQFRVEAARLADRRLYLREDLARRADEVTAAAAAQDAKRAARAPHRRRQKERDRVARDAGLTSALLRAAGQVDTGPPAAEAPSHGDVEALWRRAFSEWRDPVHAKTHLGAVDWEAMPDALDPCRGGGLGDTPRGLRKRLQVESFLAVLRQVLTRLAPDGRGVSIYDMGCGTGNLCLPLAHALPHCTWVAVDVKQDSIARCADRARRAGLRNVVAVHGDIVASARQPGAPPVDIAMGLHVCGSGTDLVLDVATSARAVFVVSPCCVGKLNVGTCGACGPKSALIRARLATDEFSVLAAAADFAGDSHVSGYDASSPTGALPRASKACVEFDRASAAAEKGYTVHLVKLLHPEACVRNDLLVGWPASERGGNGDMCGDLFLPPAGVDTHLMAV